MIEGAVATVYVEDMEQSVDFYTDALGLRLAERYGDQYALVDAGGGFHVGLRISTEHSPPFGKVGSMTIGFQVSEPIDQVKERLEDEGVEFSSGILGGTKAAVRLAFFSDPDGNRLYLMETAAVRADFDS